MRMHVSVVCVCVYEKCTIAHSNGNYLHIGHWFTWCCCSKNNNRNNWQWQPHAHIHTHTYANVNMCAYVCVVYVGLLISFLLGYVLCEITQVQPTVIFVEVCFVSVPKAIFSLSFYLTLSLSVAFFNYCIYCVYIIICMQILLFAATYFY